MEDSPETIYHVVDKWDATQVKNILDETAKQYVLDRFKYQESHYLIDIRLVLCALPVFSSFYALIYDFLYPFPQSANVMRICVYSYLILMTILTLYSTFVESHTILIGNKKGRGKNKSKIVVRSWMKRYDEHYTLTIVGPKNTVSLNKSVGNYFDVNGVFIEQKFEQEIFKLHKEATNKNH